ncbi:MAG: heparinase II/III family protein [Lentisphaeria bacterium]|nr:heparinase II/III family protein [Lentisphaeria bacterium]
MCIQAVCGFASGDRQLIEEAINGAWDPERNAYLYGIVQQLTHSVFADGVHWERCMGYTYYTGSALMYTLVAAQNSGIDLWQAELPGILGPFVGGAPHEEFGPAGNRSFKAFLDAPFYYAFPGGGFARIGDSNTSRIAYHPMYELAWREYRDPKYAWLIRRERDGGAVQAPAYWQVWRARGAPEWSIEEGEGHPVVRLATKDGERIALVQNVLGPGDQPVVVSGRVKAVRLAGGKAHIRCNLGSDTYFTASVAEAGDWQEVEVEIPAAGNALPRRIRLHVFLEGGAGEVLWDDIRVRAKGTGLNLVHNGTFTLGAVEGRPAGFWDLVNGVAEVPEGEYDLAKDATIGLVGRHVNGSTLFPVGGFAILRSQPNDPDSLAVNLSFGPYGSGHCHPDQLTVTVHAFGQTVCPDAGSWGYEEPMHLTWANQTVAHNTISINEIAQELQRLSRSIWAAERGDQRVVAVCRLFHSGEQFKAVRATCDTSYPGTRLDRTVCLVGPYLLDVYRVAGEAEQMIDLPLHGRGEVASETATTLLAENPFSGLGYTHFEDIRRGRPDGLVRGAFNAADYRVDVLRLAPAGSELYLLRDPARNDAKTTCLLSRVRAAEARFVTLLAPSRAEGMVADMTARQAGEELWVEVSHGQGTDRWILPDRMDGDIRLERLDRQGKALAGETAEAEWLIP